MGLDLMNMNRVWWVIPLIVMFVVSYPVSATHDYKLGIKIDTSWGSGPSWEVSAIRPSGIGAKSGLKVGDHILSYDGHKFTMADPQQWKEVFTQSKTHHLIEIEISRSGREMTLTVDNRTNQEIARDKARDKESEEKENAYFRLQIRVDKLAGDYKTQGEQILSRTAVSKSIPVNPMAASPQILIQSLSG